MGLMPSETDRASTASQIEGIERMLRPGDQQEMTAHIAAMLLGFPVYGGDEETAGATLDLYAGNCADLPAWAVADACEKLARGKGPGKPGNRPSAAEVRIMAERATAPHRMTIAKLKRVLAAEPISRERPSPQARASVAAKVGDILAKLSEGGRA